MKENQWNSVRINVIDYTNIIALLCLVRYNSIRNIKNSKARIYI